MILYAMRLITSEEAELETYQLNDVAQAWYVKWRDNRPLRGEPVTSEIFKKDFIYMLFPRDNREANVVEFINLREGGMSVLKYCFKLTKLSKCAPSLISGLRDEMSRFLTGLLDGLKEECHYACYMKI